MSYIFLSQYLLSASALFLAIYIYKLVIKIENKQEILENKQDFLAEKQEKEYQHLLKNIKYSGNLLEKIIQKENEK
jgi:hypothetical protein